jgi:hypothetical protein
MKSRSILKRMTTNPVSFFGPASALLKTAQMQRQAGNSALV